ncbi:MAG: PspC domain-containing protein, partial [Sphingomonadales bacterium]
MNKTVSIHIQGFAFILEDKAYEQLSAYLNELNRVLQHEEGKEEIIQDVELRIVELLQEKVTGQQVVQLQVIEQIIQLLGSPEAFGDDENASSDQATFEKMETFTAEKRFFRDKESAILGGVASGVAAYFNIDVVFVRVAFFVFTLV